MAFESALLTASRPQTELLHLLLYSSHRAHMLNVELLSRILELVHHTFHLFKVRVDLCSILIININDLYQAFLEHKSLLL